RCADEDLGAVRGHGEAELIAGRIPGLQAATVLRVEDLGLQPDAGLLQLENVGGSGVGSLSVRTSIVSGRTDDQDIVLQGNRRTEPLSFLRLRRLDYGLGIPG